MTTARVLCSRAISSFVRPCWYRYFLELPPKKAPENAAGVRGLCVGLSGEQRVGCIAAAALVTSPDPFTQLRICARLRGADSVSCLYGLNVQNLAESPRSHAGQADRGLLEAHCEGPHSLLQVARDGAGSGHQRPLRRPCLPLHQCGGPCPCLAGARRMNDALVSFS